MGWKTFKQHYGITGQVVLKGDLVSIGSGYLPDLIQVNTDGQVVKEYLLGQSGEFYDLQVAIKADPDTAKRLLAATDTFERSLVVYTYDGAEILEKFCEELGYPNVTHDGLMMYVDNFSTDRNEVIDWALKNARASASHVRSCISEAEQDLARLKGLQVKYDQEVAALRELAGVATNAVVKVIEPRTVISITDNVCDYNDVEAEVCKVLGVKDLRAEGLGFDFWVDVWLGVDDDMGDCHVSSNVISIDNLIDQYTESKEPEVVRVLEAYKKVLGDEASHKGVQFEYN